MRTLPIVVLLCVGCSFDWDGFDPRLATDGGGTAIGGSSPSGGGAGKDAAGGSGGSSDGGGGAGAGAGGAGGSGGSGGAGIFTDDFRRADGAAIGNGWIEKQPDAFALLGGRVVKTVTILSYQDNMVFRPMSEDLLDVEISLEFDVTGTVRYPQIFARAQWATLMTAGEYDGYLLYVSGSASEAVLGRQIGTPFVTTLETLSISPALTMGETYRLRLSAAGTSPVKLAASIERRNGATWETIASAGHNDAASNRIDQAGTVGFAGDEQDTFSYDQFTRTPL